MDHHVAEQAAGRSDIGNGRRTGVTRQDRHQFDIADNAFIDTGFQRTKVRIKAAVKADHQRYAGLLDNFQRLGYALGIQINRLFAEDRLAGLRRTLNEVRMRRGWRANHYRINVFGRKDRINVANFRTGRLGQRFCRLWKRVGNRNQLSLRRGRSVASMNLANTTSAEKSEP